MAEDDSNVPDSLLPYDSWTEEAQRQIMISALKYVADEGLPGEHHFYVSFKTKFPGVIISERLRAQYPDEMTIVLQHQFHSLIIDDKNRLFSVGLSFSGIPSVLTIPFAAVSSFADPFVRFGLHFDVVMPETILSTEVAEEPEQTESAPPREGPADVVSLDAFRRRQKD